jgi:ribosomal-protein-alanine N-acetyltransferase
LSSFTFEHLKLHRVAAGVMPRNHASKRVLEKLGFQKEGLLRENVCINGVWEDHLQYSILQKEWLQDKKQI